MNATAQPILSASGLTKEFAGFVAVKDVNLSVREGTVHALIGPNGAGKTTVFNLISRLYPPSGGEIHFQDRRIDTLPAHAMAGLGIARTFQNIELFEYASVLQNLLIGRHTHLRRSTWREMLFTTRVRDQERPAARE